MIDTHTHLNFKSFDKDWQTIVNQSIKAGVEKMIVVGTDIDSSQKAVNLTAGNPPLFASIGIHPHHVKQLKSKTDIPPLIAKLKAIATQNKVIAIGEIGLDYHYYKNSKYHNTKITPHLIDLQKSLLKLQIELAIKQRLPLIIHSREAKEDVLNILKSYFINHKSISGVFHCFDGSIKYAKKIIDAGFYISFTGQITYSQDRNQAAATIPLDRLLLETDCPFMPPEPKRTKSEDKTKLLRSQPSDVKIIGSYHAKTRGISVTKVIAQTTKNAYKLFGFK
jgi:TatD DNase family protein